MDRSANMRAIRSKDTIPELTIRRLIFSLGYRYRLHRRDLPGAPDIVFPARRKAIFVHGCFWHSHTCKAAHTPKTNLQYWGPKLARNRVRFERASAALSSMGWDILVIWECQTNLVESLSEAIQRFLDGNRSTRRRNAISNSKRLAR
ncbi:MAG: very short patch repair endonuclease [Terracidiphilus sp.]